MCLGNLPRCKGSSAVVLGVVRKRTPGSIAAMDQELLFSYLGACLKAFAGDFEQLWNCGEIPVGVRDLPMPQVGAQSQYSLNVLVLLVPLD